MPQIRSYELQTKAAGVPDVQQASPEAFGQVGRAMQGTAQQGLELSGAIQKRQAQSDLSDLHVNLSKAQADLTTQYQDELQKGTLDTEKFSQDVEDNLQSIGDQSSTREGRLYFEQASATLKAHFMEHAAAGQAQLAGAKAKDNFVTTLNNNSTTLINDPSSFDLTNQLQQQGIDNLVQTGGLPAAEAGTLKAHAQNALAKSAVRGWINIDPEGALKQLNDGKWDKILGDKETPGGMVKEQLIGQADQAIRARSIEDERFKRQEKEAKLKLQTDTQNDFLNKMQTDDLSTKDILKSNLDPIGSGSKETFLKLLEAHEKAKSEKIQTDSATYINLWDRIHLDDGDPQKLVNENDLNKYMGRGLTVENINVLRAEIQGKKTTGGADEAELKKGLTDIAKGKLTSSNPLIGKKDPEGDTQYQKWLSQFQTEYAKQRQAGKTPQQLSNPDSPDYLLKNVNQYIRSTQQVIKSVYGGSQNQNPAVAPVGEQMVDVISPTGVAGKLPQSKVEAAKKAGFKVK